MIALSSVAQRLPMPVTFRVARLVGAGWYLAAPRRRSLARANLLRVCRYLVEAGMARPGVAAASRDPRALERLLRSAFQHFALYYLEVLLLPRYTATYVLDHLAIDDPALVEALMGENGPGHHAIFVAMHFGALEIPSLYITQVRGIPIVAPMETLDNAPLQDALLRARARTAITILPLRGSGPALAAAFAAGSSIGLVADRDIRHSGTVVDFFGHPAPLPTGPAIFAVESGAALMVVAARRTRPGEYAGAVIPIEMPGTGSRRERVRLTVQAMAHAMERLVAAAPEQWWTIFFPVWPDLRMAAGTTAPAARDAFDAPTARGTHAAPDGEEPTSGSGTADVRQ